MKVQGASGQLINGHIDPVLVPQRTLYTGARMPAIGLGTFGSDHVRQVKLRRQWKMRRRSGTGTSIVHRSTATNTRSDMHSSRS